MKIMISMTMIILLNTLMIMMTIINGQRLADYPSAPFTTVLSTMGYRDRRNKIEPTCDELRAMWRYSKRQSRDAEATNDLPMYRDPFSYNIWETYPIRSQSSIIYRDDNDGQVRNRGGGRAPVYGKMIHKAPAESRLRNGMPNRIKAFEEVARMYGTVNRQPPDSRRRQYNFRAGSGTSNVPQAGSFQHLKELIRTERARELQDQRIAEEIAARSAAMTDNVGRDGRQSELRGRYMNSIQSYQEPKNINYHFGHGQYVPSLTNFNNGLLRSDDSYDQDALLH